MGYNTLSSGPQASDFRGLPRNENTECPGPTAPHAALGSKHHSVSPNNAPIDQRELSNTRMIRGRPPDSCDGRSGCESLNRSRNSGPFDALLLPPTLTVQVRKDKGGVWVTQRRTHAQVDQRFPRASWSADFSG